MKSFSRTLNGYNIEEVDEFLNHIISQLEEIKKSSVEKDNIILELNEKLANLSYNKKVKELIDVLNTNIKKANNNGNKILLVANKEREIIISEAKKEAEDIINDALYKSKKLEEQAELLRKNIIEFKEKINKINDRDE